MGNGWNEEWEKKQTNKTRGRRRELDVVNIKNRAA